MRTLLWLGICWAASSASAQNYELLDRAGRIKATATIERGQLIVVESTGERVVFRREPRYDSPNGQLLGFLNVNLQRVLRFPRHGSGAMQVADLNLPNPRFQETMRKFDQRRRIPRSRMFPLTVAVEAGRAIPMLLLCRSFGDTNRPCLDRCCWNPRPSRIRR